MAISYEDGSIILSTKISNKGLEKGFKELKSLTKKAVLGMSVAFTAGTVAITKMAVSAYADYEQLIGGVETLFKGSADKVIRYANDAFYTAGVSANEYMRQVTSFSASLISSTAGDTEKSADIANMALIDISDNANKMGSSLESVTLAYQGFAKQQYMLLDNLKLGYGGTKTEMERLLKDAEALTGVKYDINNLADVYSAIHAIQEEMGIAGTTAKEAEKTISGSANMVKASWQNVLTAIAGGGSIDIAINNLVFSISKYFENIVPVVERALIGIGTLIEQIAPMIIQTVARSIIRAIPNLVTAIYKMIIGLGKGIWEGLKALLSGKSVEITSEMSSSVGDIAVNASDASDGMSDLGKETEKAGKKAKKFLASFDELNTIQEDAGAGASSVDMPTLSVSGDASGNAFGGLFDGSALEKEINETLGTIMAIAGVSLVAIGLILLMTGNLAWGVGFIVAGAITLGVVIGTLKDEAISQKVKDAISNALIISGLVAIVLGVLLCVAGHWATGIGMIVLGASSVATSVSLNWKGIKQQLKGTFGTVLAVVGLVAIALGVIACIGGAWAIGVGLIITGATALGTAVAFNWNGIKEALKGPLGTAIAIAGIVAILFGVLACFAQQWALGIGLIVTGALSLGVTATVNWNGIKQALQGPLGKAIAVVGVVAIIIGVLICCTGNFPLGLGLIVAGGLSIASVVTVNWNTILNKIKTVWTSVKDYWKKNIAKYFTSSWWGNLAKNAINALLRTIVNGLNRLIDRLNRFGFRVPEVLGGGWVGFNISKLAIPQLAKGAVIPANKPFLAMLGDQKHGTNIEAPLDTIKQAVAEVVANMNVGSSSGRIEVPVYLNGRQIALAVREAENSLGKQTVFGGFANAY